MDPVLHLSIPVLDLASARAFYVDVLGCRTGRVRDGWLDVWFYGLQLTLQEQPEQVRSDEERGVRHFGVTIGHAEFERVMASLSSSDVRWLSEVRTDHAGTANEQTKAKVLDPSGNAIEFKTYRDQDRAFGSEGT